jgi:hypothetical protein
LPVGRDVAARFVFSRSGPLPLSAYSLRHLA